LPIAHRLLLHLEVEVHKLSFSNQHSTGTPTQPRVSDISKESFNVPLPWVVVVVFVIAVAVAAFAAVVVVAVVPLLLLLLLHLLMGTHAARRRVPQFPAACTAPVLQHEAQT
jgi:Flp pilus assembly protein TadB